MPILAARRRSSPMRATTYFDLQAFSMGGTGLEPVTPSLSNWSSRSRPFAQVRSTPMVERIHRATERSSERERTLILAILATQLQPSRLVLNSKVRVRFG